MEQFEIAAEARELKGKGASRRLRRTGYIPGIVYGAGQEPVNIQLEHNDVIKHTGHEAFYSHILSLKLPTGTQRVVLKDMQRHPYKALVMHMDFLRVDEKEKLTMRVPLHFTNEETAIGVKSGGVVSHVMTELEVLCFPRDLPEYIEVDVAKMDLGDTLHLSDITVPSGVEIVSLLQGGDDALPVVSIHLPRAGAETDAKEEADEGTDSTE
ncbi:MAG: 50S ribosomal protein L25/general stress protein Ctc [Proteobacteria bacterium]|nr:50S ribosomal protein L25/general stress protein Ctc [Pseudomonadota bacterium]